MIIKIPICRECKNEMIETNGWYKCHQCDCGDVVRVVRGPKPKTGTCYRCGTYDYVKETPGGDICQDCSEGN